MATPNEELEATKVDAQAVSHALGPSDLNTGDRAGTDDSLTAKPSQRKRRLLRDRVSGLKAAGKYLLPWISSATVLTIATVYVTRDIAQEQLVAQAAQASSALTLQRETSQSELALNVARFIAEHYDDVFGKDSVKKDRMRQLIAVAYPPATSEEIFLRLLRADSAPGARRTWTAAIRQVRALHGARSCADTLPRAGELLANVLVQVASGLQPAAPGLVIWCTPGMLMQDTILAFGNRVVIGRSDDRGLFLRLPPNDYVLWAESPMYPGQMFSGIQLRGVSDEHPTVATMRLPFDSGRYDAFRGPRGYVRRR